MFIADMQWAQAIHAVVAVLFVAVMLAHIYTGTVGMEGAFEGMWHLAIETTNVISCNFSC
jgi:cytochrome b subunit of formate dehydrogenase